MVSLTGTWARREEPGDKARPRLRKSDPGEGRRVESEGGQMGGLETPGRGLPWDPVGVLGPSWPRPRPRHGTQPQPCRVQPQNALWLQPCRGHLEQVPGPPQEQPPTALSLPKVGPHVRRGSVAPGDGAQQGTRWQQQSKDTSATRQLSAAPHERGWPRQVAPLRQPHRGGVQLPAEGSRLLSASTALGSPSLPRVSKHSCPSRDGHRALLPLAPVAVHLPPVEGSCYLAPTPGLF